MHTLQTFFQTPCRLTRCRPYFSTPCRRTICRPYFITPCRLYTLQTLFFNTLQTLSHAAAAADLTSCRHYWPKTCCRQSCCRQTPCRQSSCRQKHPADKTCCRRKIMSARIWHVVCRKIMSAGCFGSCDETAKI